LVRTSEQTLPAAGRRTTAQRRLLLELIHEAEGHLDADELYRRARNRESKISLSTVYRNLQLFKKIGLVDERHFVEDHHHYEVKGPKEHYHLICLSCGRVIEFESSLMAGARDEIKKKHQFKVAAAHIHFEGYCAHCRSQGYPNQHDLEAGYAKVSD